MVTLVAERGGEWSKGEKRLGRSRVSRFEMEDKALTHLLNEYRGKKQTWIDLKSHSFVWVMFH